MCVKVVVGDSLWKFLTEFNLREMYSASWVVRIPKEGIKIPQKIKEFLGFHYMFHWIISLFFQSFFANDF